MFAEIEIDSTSSADSVHQSKEMFKIFSTFVFGSHFRSTRAKFGLGNEKILIFRISNNFFVSCSRINTYTIECCRDYPNSGTGWITETYCIRSSSQENEYDAEPYFPITFFNAPFSTWMYSDHNENNDYICLAVPIFSGSRDVKFTLSDDGMKVTIHYVWSEAVYKPFVLFDEAINKKRIQPSRRLTRNYMHSLHK